MKKLITILAIMVVLATAVFAVDVGSAAINVTANIAAQTPSLQLRLAAAANIVAATTANVGGEAATTGLLTNGVSTLSGGKDLELDFDIFQTSIARLSVATGNETYTFAISVTDMILQDGNGNVANATANQIFTVLAEHPTINSLSTNSSAEANYQIDIDKDHTGTKVTTATVTGGEGSLQVVYKGFVDENTVLGNFKAGWHGNASAVPGTYKSTVTMTVTTN